MSELELENKTLRSEIYVLKERIAQLERLIFSSKRERFISEVSTAQGSLFDEEQVVDQPTVTEEQTTTITKKKKKSRKGVKRNTFPDSLQREQIIINPQDLELEGLTKIGEDITEILAYTPAKVHVKQIVRPRYVDKADEDKGVFQAPIPPRIIPKGMVDNSLIIQLIIEKIQFHTPVYRFVRKLKQLDINFIKRNNLYNYFHRTAESLLPIYHLLQQDVLDTKYVQADESHIKVLSKNKPGASHRGQMWVFFAPTINATFFNYNPHRSTEAASQVLAGYKGTLQSDGYNVYKHFAKSKDVTLIHCMAHARRKFYEAKDNEPALADWFLTRVQQLYDIERHAREKEMTTDQRLELRQKKAIPILNELKEWLVEKSADRTILPSSMIRKAIDYSLALWHGLSAYAYTGVLEIDNNLVENTIRPVALGRKNYLFAGSHDAAQNLAILYSIIGTCEKNNINTFKYLNWLLDKVATTKITADAINWLPHRINTRLFD